MIKLTLNARRPLKRRYVLPSGLGLVWLVLSAAVLFLIAAILGPAKAATCPAYAKVAAWGAISHQSTIDYVNAKYQGDWAPYVEKWETRLVTLETARARGATVIFPRQGGLRLNGWRLAAYIEKIRRRKAVALCLAAEEDEKTPETLADFATAAGPLSSAGAGTDTGSEPVAETATEVQLKVNTACTNGTAMFKVMNVGGRWPKAGTFAVYAIDGKKLLSERRMLLTGGQKASFKVKALNEGETVLGLWVEPSWYARDFRYDAKVFCG